MDLLSLGLRVVARARPGEDVEAFLTHARDFQAKAYGGDIESVSSAEPRGLGVRSLSGGRAGFAYTTDLSDEGVGRALEQSRENAAHSTPDEAVAIAAAWTAEPPPVEGLIDPLQGEIPADRKVTFALELERATRAADPRISVVEEAVYSDSDTEVAIATSTGIASTYRETSAWCYAYAIASEGDETEVGFEFDLGRGIAELDPAAVGGRAAARATQILGARKIASTVMPVVFDPHTSAQFLGVLSAALTGEAVQKGRSLFAGKLGQQVAGAGVTLVDDGRAPGAPGSSPWDAEGVPTRRTEVIGGGTLTSFLYDITSARRAGVSSTGNAGRAGFKSGPGPSPTNLAFDPTGETREEALAKGGRALLVQDFHGVHSGANPVSGDFSVGVTGRLLEGGAPGQPVKEVTIAAPMLEILSRMVAVADDRRWFPFGGSYGGSTTLIAEMTVAGS